MGEIRKLTLELVSPFLAVEEVVAEPPDDHQHGEEPIAWIGVAAIENRLDDSGLVGGAQMQMRIVMSEGAVGEIALLFGLQY
ncbi:hypothetical protein PY365_00140 [Roseiarcaceae bacterium H3SJ34-1]|uniref:hypothetical protein n=1 Tax=Terripilifer ovatus TaxID=3032367 RepID=UPI003AB97E1A|nr:hypothetical protein [Roseiarcaceae bacterium H3SJ34-1]